MRARAHTQARTQTHQCDYMSIGQLYGLRCGYYRDQRRNVCLLYTLVSRSCWLDDFCSPVPFRNPLSSIAEHTVSATQENVIVKRDLDEALNVRCVLKQNCNKIAAYFSLRKICYKPKCNLCKVFLTNVFSAHCSVQKNLANFFNYNSPPPVCLRPYQFHWCRVDLSSHVY